MSTVVGELLARSIATRAADVAVVDGDMSVTWSALGERVAAFAAHLTDLGIGRGGRAALWLPNGLDYVVATLALARQGALAVHVNTRFGAHEVGDLIERTRPTVLVTRSGFAGVDLAAIREIIPASKLSSVRAVVDSTVTPAPRGVAVDLGTDPGPGTAEDDVLVFTTGGTTAKPKLVVHKQRSVAHHAAAVASRLGLDRPRAALLAVVPFCGTFGNVALMAAIAGGARIVTMSAFDEARADALVREHAITHVAGDDRMVARMADVAETKGPYPSVRFTAVAGFHPGAAEAFARAAAVGLRPHAIYGSSEVQALFATGDPAALGLGAVTPVDAESRVRIAEGDDGELLLGGPSLFDRYLDDPDATRVARPGGSFHTGDRARREGVGGSFHFEGRLGDTLRLGGFLVSPAEIETFLQTLPAVAAAQVVAVETQGRRAAFAFVVERDGERIDEAALLAACRAQLARYKVPAGIARLDAFPTSNGPNGPKISRAELRDRALSILKGDHA